MQMVREKEFPPHLEIQFDAYPFAHKQVCIDGLRDAKQLSIGWRF
jgi:hypothetical protein